MITLAQVHKFIQLWQEAEQSSLQEASKKLDYQITVIQDWSDIDNISNTTDNFFIYDHILSFPVPQVLDVTTAQLIAMTKQPLFQEISDFLIEFLGNPISIDLKQDDFSPDALYYKGIIWKDSKNTLCLNLVVGEFEGLAHIILELRPNKKELIT